jgi:hypothetical protein
VLRIKRSLMCASDEGGESGGPPVRVQINTDSFSFGTVSTIERVTMQTARRLATPSELCKNRRTSA